MKVVSVFVGQARPAVAPFFEAALELCEEAKVIAEVPVGVEKIALQNISRTGLEVRAETGVFVIFVTVADFTAKGDVPVFAA